MKTKALAGLLVFAAALLQGCAHTKLDRELDEKMRNEVSIHDPSALGTEAKQAFDSIPNLTLEQRRGLSSVQEKARIELTQYRDQSLKLRSILIKELAEPKYDPYEIELIKTRLSKLEHKRLMALFNAIEEVNTILGHESTYKGLAVQGFLAEHPRTD